MILFTLNDSVDNNTAEILNYLKMYTEQIYIPHIKAREEFNFIVNVIRSQDGTESEHQEAIKAYNQKLESLLETLQRHSVPKECRRHAAICMQYYKRMIKNNEQKPHLQETNAIYRSLKMVSLRTLATNELEKLRQLSRFGE